MVYIERNSEWEKRKDVVKAYTVGVSVYYIVYYKESNCYNLECWPDKRKKTETVSIIDGYDTKEESITALEEKIESKRD